MAQTEYRYTISTATANGAVTAGNLKDEYEASSIVTALDHISAAGDSLSIFTKDVLSAGDKTTLDAVILAHQGLTAATNIEVKVYDPISNKAFSDAGGLKFRGTGISDTATKTTTTDIDYKLTEDRFINGVDILVKGHVWGDKLDFQVVDVDNILGYGAGVVLDEFGKDWYVDPDKKDQGQILISYPALINKDLYIRIKYHSVGTVNDVELKCNMFLHKKP